MPLILHIETATDVCSVCLASDGVVTGLEESHAKNSHASMLHVMIDAMLKKSGISYDRLDAIAVSMGPGSYTGLRIGVAAAKGFCFALDKPLIAINTLQAMTACFIEHAEDLKLPGDARFCPMIDARRMEVYSAIFDTGFNFIVPTQALILTEFSYADLLSKQPVYFFGDGALKASKIIHHQNAHFDNNFSTSSAGLCKLALQAWNTREFMDTAYFEPYYLKDFMTGSQKSPKAVNKR